MEKSKPTWTCTCSIRSGLTGLDWILTEANWKFRLVDAFERIFYNRLQRWIGKSNSKFNIRWWNSRKKKKLKFSIKILNRESKKKSLTSSNKKTWQMNLLKTYILSFTILSKKSNFKFYPSKTLGKFK